MCYFFKIIYLLITKQRDEFKLSVSNDGNGDILIIGAGAIGGTTGAILHDANVDVTLLNRKGLHYDAIKANGLKFEDSDKIYNVNIESNISDLKKKYNHIIISVKNIHTEDIMKQLKKVISKTTLIYSFQNGFGNTEIMAKYVPKEQIVAAVIGWGANVIKPGVIRITSRTGDFVIGFEDGQNSNDPRLLDIQKKLSIWKPTIVTNNIIGFRWSKLIVNTIIAPTGGLLGLTLGEVMSDQRMRNVITALKEEGIMVAERYNIELEKVDGLNIRNFFYRPQPNDKMFKRLKNQLISNIIAKVGARRHGKIRSSLLLDLENNRKTEIDFLNGYVSRKAKEIKIETPVNAFLTKTIKEIEQGKRPIGLQNLEELRSIADQSLEQLEKYKQQ